MNIVICGNCSWIGVKSQLKCTNDSSGIDSEIIPLLRENNMWTTICPKCGSSKIFYPGDQVNNSTPVVVSPPLQTEDVEPIESDELDDRDLEIKNAVDSMFDASEEEPVADDVEPVGYSAQEEELRKSISEKGDKKTKRVRKTKQVKRAKSNRKPMTFWCKCDTCEERFQSKVEGETRCPPCLEETVGGL